MAKVLFNNLKKQDTQLRFAATLLCFHVLPAFTSPIQAIIFFTLFLTHALYLIIDGHSLISSIQIHWVSSETRNLREGIIDTCLALLQFVASSFTLSCLFGQTLLNTGILSVHMMPVVAQYYSILINDLYRSGYMFALTFSRQQLESGELNFFSRTLTRPDISYLIAFSFCLITILYEHAILSLCYALPFIGLSVFYCLDIIAYSTNKQAISPDGNYFSSVIIGCSHSLSFGAWATILSTALSICMGALPTMISSQLMPFIPKLLAVTTSELPINYIASTSGFAVFAEVIRSKIYASIGFNPESSLAIAQSDTKTLKTHHWPNNRTVVISDRQPSPHQRQQRSPHKSSNRYHN